MYEFFWTTDKNRLMVHDRTNDKYFPLTSAQTELIDRCEQKIQQDYPETWYALKLEYPSPTTPIPWEIRFKRINRFLKCNFSVHDNRPDIDDDWNFDFERVPCPLRRECPHEYCNPKLTHKLTKREIEIIELHVEGLSQNEIGKRLYISGLTVKNHVYKIYKKLGFTGENHPETKLINYAYQHKLVS
ncbi:MAG: response regulator transcription factor [Bacteroidales bacterium]|nr:response regulator transcription factor [Bacteroidales bacterium]